MAEQDKNINEKHISETGNSSAVSSNIKNEVGFRARHFQFTLNIIEKYNDLKNYLTSYSTLKYFISCKETAPTTGHEHIHIYCRFSQPKTIKPKNVFGAHIEVCKGSPEQNIAYIKKDGNILDELGEKPCRGGNTFLSINDVKNMSRSERRMLDFRYKNLIKDIEIDEDNDLDIEAFHKDVEVIYICGPSGAGKTLRAIDMIRSKGFTKFNNVKYENGFWMGIGNADCALYDDFRDSHMKASEFINFIDYNVHTMNVKGGVRINRYVYIIITSVMPIEELYKKMDDEPKMQWLRRVKVINMYSEEINKILEELEDK